MAYAALTAASALAAAHVDVGVQLYELVPRDSFIARYAAATDAGG